MPASMLPTSVLQCCYDVKKLQYKYYDTINYYITIDTCQTGGTCFEENISRKQKQNLTVMQNFECMCIMFMVVINFNGGSQSGCCSHNQHHH